MAVRKTKKAKKPKPKSSFKTNKFKSGFKEKKFKTN